MNNEIDTKEKQSFPWKAFAVYAAGLIASLILDLWTTDLGPEAAEFGAGVEIFLTVGSLIFALVFALIATAIQYAFIKFPTQWISNEKDVYQNEIWAAIFYSGTVAIVLNLLATLTSYQENILVGLLINIIVTALFIYIYFSGTEKEAHVKKAIVIVHIIWLVLGIGINIIGNMALTNLSAQ